MREDYSQRRLASAPDGAHDLLVREDRVRAALEDDLAAIDRIEGGAEHQLPVDGRANRVRLQVVEGDGADNPRAYTPNTARGTRRDPTLLRRSSDAGRSRGGPDATIGG